MKALLILFALLSASLGISAQEVFDLDTLGHAETRAATTIHDIYFSYDASGNRTESYIVLVPLLQSPGEDSEEQQQEALPTAEFTVGPSPTNGEVTVALTRADVQTSYAVTIHNTSGQPVTTKTTASPSVTLDITSQPPGVYFVGIEAGGQRKNVKIIKK